jgi:hypothetical protein
MGVDSAAYQGNRKTYFVRIWQRAAWDILDDYRRRHIVSVDAFEIIHDECTFNRRTGHNLDSRQARRMCDVAVLGAAEKPWPPDGENFISDSQYLISYGFDTARKSAYRVPLGDFDGTISSKARKQAKDLVAERHQALEVGMHHYGHHTNLLVT